MEISTNPWLNININDDLIQKNKQFIRRPAVPPAAICIKQSFHTGILGWDIS